MSVRTEEEEEKKNSSSGRGFGLAVAAVGVGIGAALYYMFSKRQDDAEASDSRNGVEEEQETRQQNLDRNSESGEFEEDWYSDSEEQAEQNTATNQPEEFRQRRWSLELCSICHDVVIENPDSAAQQPRTLPCGHNFHEACVQPWLAKHGICPNCRREVGV